MALGFLAYSAAVTYEFAYDDRWTIVENHWLQYPWAELLGRLASGRAAADGVPDATRPLMVLVHALERRIFGLAPWAFHLDSVLLYGVVCALAARLALVLGERRLSALVAGCFFALAPVHAEVVAAVNYREDLYAAFGSLATLSLLFAPASTAFRARKADPVDAALLAGACLGIGLLGKESALATLPLAAVTARLVPRARRQALAKPRMLSLLALVSASWFAWRMWIALRGDGLPLAPHRSFGQLLLRTARFEVHAVWSALWPLGYAPDYWRQPDAGLGWAVPFLSLVTGSLMLAENPKTRLPAVGIGFALAAPLASCPLVGPVNEFADRYFFLGVLGGGMVWAWALAWLCARFRWTGRARYTLVPLACVLLFVLTERAAAIWRNDRTLWTAAVERTPTSPRAWAALSDVYRTAGERARADAAVERALRENPHYPPALVSEVYGDLAFGRLELARERLANLARRSFGDGGGIAKAKHCATLDRESAARCINR